jgi:hypothetical protein
MNILSYIKNGVSLVSHYLKMILVIYAINFSLALLLAVPLFFSLSNQIGKQGVRDQLDNAFQYDWWNEFHFNANGIEETIRPTLSGGFAPLFDNLELMLTGHFNTFGVWILVFGFAYLCLSAFLNGGVIGLYAEERRSFSVSRFFSFAGLYFHHFFAITMTSVLLYFIVYKFLSIWIFAFIHLFTSAGMNDHLIWFIHLVGYCVVLVIIIFFNIVLDYTKIILVIEKKDSAWLSLWEAIKFIVKHFLQVLGLYSALAVIAIGMVLIFGLIFNALNHNPVFLVILLIIFQQVFILLKIGLRLTFYGSQLLFYQFGHSQERKLKKIKI